MSGTDGSPPVTVVTGGAGTLGRAIATDHAERGDTVVLLDRDRDAVESAAATLGRDTGRELLGWALDVTAEAAVDRTMRRIESHWGRVDRLVNNAAVNPRYGLAEQDVAGWQAAMEVNAQAALLMCRATLPLWRTTGFGRVVNMVSRTWLGGGPVAYVASKAALVGLTRSLAVELGPLGVTVNAVAPSVVATGFTRGGRSDAEFEAMVARHIAITPVGRLATPADVAAAVGFLTSARAGFVTGEVLHVCGGSQLAASAAPAADTSPESDRRVPR